MPISSLAAALLAGAVLAPSLVLAQAEGAQPPAKGMPLLQQVQLTDATAKEAIDAYLEIKEKYGEEALPTTEAGAVAKGAEVKSGVTSIVDDAGFKDIGDWTKTVTSIALAYGVIKEGGLAKVDPAIAKIDDNPQIPEQMKAQLKAMLLEDWHPPDRAALIEELEARRAEAKRAKVKHAKPRRRAA